ncbi:MAG: adenosine kinase [Arenicella sp.]
MNTLITGSMAFDTIMVFEGQFKNHILPDQAHIFNVSFLTPTMQRFQGGCAGNMAYTYKMLGGQPLIMAAVGEDFGSYSRWLDKLGFNQDYIATIEGQFTAQAFITTDMDNNQINAFHPGAMNFAHQNKVSDAPDVGLGIVGPDGRDAMLAHATQFAEAKIPFFFDPGQQLPVFNGEELLRFCDQATYAIMNDYESQMLVETTGLPLEELVDRVEAFIVTKGGQGSVIYVGGEQIEIPSAPIEKAVDPTGCGDAYRAGIMYGVSLGLDWPNCGRIASLCGAIKIESSGTQGHEFSKQSFAERYNASFGEAYPA